MSPPSQTSPTDSSSGHEDCSSHELQSTIDKILALKDLESNWDSYGACPVDPKLAEAASRFLEERIKSGTPLPCVVPTVRGSVQFEWDCRGIYLDMEFMTPTKVSLLLETTDPETSREFELPVNSDEIDRLLGRLPRDC